MPVVTDIIPRGDISSVDVVCDIELDEDSVGDPADFVLTYAGSPEDADSASIFEKTIRITRQGWEDSNRMDFLEFGGGEPGTWLSLSGGQLQPFDLPVPYPV